MEVGKDGRDKSIRNLSKLHSEAFSYDNVKEKAA